MSASEPTPPLASERRPTYERLTLRPTTLRAAKAFVGQEHRHHPPTTGHKFSVSVVDDEGKVRGVAVAGRPVARQLDDGVTLEVLRVATDGARNACSMLYGAARRSGHGMGYQPGRIITYTLISEPGTSLLAAGWVPVSVTDEEDWDRPSRRRNKDHHPTERKVRWHARLPVGAMPLPWPPLCHCRRNGYTGVVVLGSDGRNHSPSCPMDWRVAA